MQALASRFERRSASLRLIAFAVVIILIGSGSLVFVPKSVSSYSGHTIPGVPTRGLPVSVSSFSIQAGNVTPISGANVTVFTADPYAVGNPAWAGINITSSVYPDAGEIELLNVTTGPGGTYTGTLGPTFLEVAHEWTQLLDQATTTQTVALQIHAIYANVTQAGVAQLFSYYDNFPYNPWNPPSQISFGVYFNLSNPIYSGSGSAPSGGGGSSGSPIATQSVAPTVARPDHLTCTPNSASWKILGSWNVTGPYPIAMANDSAPRDTNDYIDLTQSTSTGSLSAGWTSVSASDALGSKSVEMSAKPSYNGSQSGYGSSMYGGAATSNLSQAYLMFYLSKVTIWAFSTQMTAVYYSGYTCQKYTTVANFNDLQVIGIQMNSHGNSRANLFAILVGGENHIFGEILTNDISQGSWTVKSQGNLGGGKTKLYSTYEATISGWSNAASIESRVVAAANIESAAIGIDLAVMTATNICGAICLPADVGGDLGVVSAIAGFALTLISSLSSMTYTVSTSWLLDGQSITNGVWNIGNPAKTFAMYLAGSGSTVTLTTPTTSVNPYVPDIYVIACPFATSPGSGC